MSYTSNARSVIIAKRLLDEGFGAYNLLSGCSYLDCQAEGTERPNNLFEVMVNVEPSTSSAVDVGEPKLKLEG